MDGFSGLCDYGAFAADDRFWNVGIIKTTSLGAGDALHKRAVLANGLFRTVARDLLCSRIPVDDLHFCVDDEQAAWNGAECVFERDVLYDGVVFCHSNECQKDAHINTKWPFVTIIDSSGSPDYGNLDLLNISLQKDSATLSYCFTSRHDIVN